MLALYRSFVGISMVIESTQFSLSECWMASNKIGIHSVILEWTILNCVRAMIVMRMRYCQRNVVYLWMKPIKSNTMHTNMNALIRWIELHWKMNKTEYDNDDMKIYVLKWILFLLYNSIYIALHRSSSFSSCFFFHFSYLARFFIVIIICSAIRSRQSLFAAICIQFWCSYTYA